MTRNEKKIDNLEHAVLKIDDYIKYSSHTIDAVYIDAQNRLIEQFVKDEDYERASIVKKKPAVGRSCCTRRNETPHERKGSRTFQRLNKQRI